MVSPIARLRPTMSAATMPETAAGSTTRNVVVILRAPRPDDASRNASGTDRMASSEMDATSGMVRKPTATPAAAMLKKLAPGAMGWMRFGVMKLMANRPSTTLGTLARTSRIGFSTRLTLGLAYSDR